MSENKDLAAKTSSKPAEKLRMHERVVAKLSASMGFCVFCAVLLVSLIALWIIGNYYDAGWAAEQWGPVAAWFGGMLTAGAVTLSLYQSREARREAKRNREDADRRHTEQIEQSKRHRQVDTISPIWVAIGESLTPTNIILNDIERVVLTDASFQSKQPSDEGYETYKARRDAAVKKLTDDLPAFADTTYAVELSFSNAMMVVEQPKVVETVEDLYQAFIDLRNAYGEMAVRALSGEKVDLKQIKSLRSHVNKSRDPMIKAVREHLTKAAPLRKFDT
ncbi:hypothetical protein HQO82_19305 [Rhodococcus fascians]|nr:hypothetical protein [Rhodococcus fascians]MBY4115978.1 hypothetical protein [Rhodococcus fascians]